jgi:hypothetical protein
MGILFHILIWVVIIVVANLVLRAILKGGWRSLLTPFQSLIPKRSVRNDRKLWDHITEDSND